MERYHNCTLMSTVLYVVLALVVLAVAYKFLKKGGSGNMQPPQQPPQM